MANIQKVPTYIQKVPTPPPPHFSEAADALALRNKTAMK